MISEYLSDYSYYRWLLLAPSSLPVGNSRVEGGPRCPSSPLQDDNSREMSGAWQCDTPTTPAPCQQKSSQNWSMSSQSQTASTIKARICPLACCRKTLLFFSRFVGFFHDSNSIKHRAMKAVKEQVCGNSDHRMKAQ